MPHAGEDTVAPRSGQQAVLLNISMSLDGFIAGPNVDAERPMGDGGEQLHDWMFAGSTPRDVEIVDEVFRDTGAFVMGRRTFDLGEAPWGDDTFHVPCFVVTHHHRDTVIKGSAPFTFVTDGVESALRQARAAAGEKSVTVMGGTGLAQEFVRAGLLDEMQIHLVPVLLSAGTSLFERLGTESIELERTSVIETPGATHLRFRVLK